MAFLALLLSLCFALPAPRSRAALEDAGARAPEAVEPALGGLFTAPVLPEISLISLGDISGSGLAPLSRTAAPEAAIARVQDLPPERAPEMESPKAAGAQVLSAPDPFPQAPPAALASASALVHGRAGSLGSTRENTGRVFDGGRPLDALASGGAAAEAAIQPAAAQPALLAGPTGLVRAPDMKAGLARLRESSYPIDRGVGRLIQAISRAHPELPISPERVFLVRDAELLESLGLPEDAAGAARIITDGRAEAPVVLIAARHGVQADRLVEFAVHEAVHLMDGGILRVPNERALSHLFAEGWTQKRAVDMANDVLPSLGLPKTPGRAYRKEIALSEAFAARHGTAALNGLVREGKDDDLRRAMGSRWNFALELSRSGAPREKKLNALIALISAPSFGPAEEKFLRDYLGL